MATWRCIKGCGACCHLEPADRPDLDLYLSPQDMDHYLSLVGDDGWCINFDPATRECRIYEERPRFCRVEADIFQELYDVDPADLNDFAIECCCDQITAVHGDRSLELLRFQRETGL